MQGTFSGIITSSWEWTKTVLFKPFGLKKWLFLCLIGLMAGEFSGCNMNINLPARQTPHPVIAPAPWLLPVIITAGAAVLLLSILFFWLYSRFSFIFLSSVLKNDASIKAPFGEHRYIGNSFFGWNLFFFLTIILLFLSAALFLIPLIKVHIILLLPWGFLLFLLIVIVITANVTVHDLVLPIMFKDKAGIIKAWREAIVIIKREKLNFTKYLLIKLGLRIAAVIAGGLFSVAVMFVLLIQLAVLGGVLYSISFVLPGVIRLGYYTLLILLGITALLGIIFIINLVLLPIPVFFRAYSVRFLAAVDERYKLEEENP